MSDKNLSPGKAIVFGSFIIAGGIFAAALVLPGSKPVIPQASAQALPSAALPDTAAVAQAPSRIELAAAPAPATGTPGRFQIVKTENGTAWRLDTVTGEITVCRLESDRMICAKSTEATELPKATPEQLQKQRVDQKRERKAEKTEMIDRFFSFFERMLRFADRHSDKQEAPAKKDEYARPL
jgi:hypothetical protein